VLATGLKYSGQCDVQSWHQLVSISAKHWNTVGLTSDGTVVIVGKIGYLQCDISSWRDIVAISAGSYRTVGLKSDGTVMATGVDTYGECNVSSWHDIVAVSAGSHHTVALKVNGSVVATGDNGHDQRNVRSWKLFDSLDELHTLLKEREKEAEQKLQSKIKELQAEEIALKTERSNLKGLFAGVRRKQIEARLAEIESTLSKL
jgi:hypothetical protein